MSGIKHTADEWKTNLIHAVEAQANDETLWCTGGITAAEAYMQQSLRWLHQVIEENDLQALQSIINQSTGDI